MPITRLLLRPFGYLLLGCVWLAIVGIALLVAAALPAMLRDIPLSESVLVERMQGGSVGDWVGIVVFTPVLGICFGILVMVLVASLVQVALCLLYVVRSLMPRYSDWALSASGTSDIGPYGGTAISLLPLDRTRLSDLLMRVNAIGWGGNRWSFLGQSIIGVAYLVATMAFAWPVVGAAATVCTIVAVVIAASGLVFTVRGAAAVEL